jgi:hypothetical protein
LSEFLICIDFFVGRGENLALEISGAAMVVGRLTDHDDVLPHLNFELERFATLFIVHQYPQNKSLPKYEVALCQRHIECPRLLVSQTEQATL